MVARSQRRISGRTNARSQCSDGIAIGDDWMEELALDHRRRFGGSGVAAHDQRTLLLSRAQGRHLSYVWVGRSRFGVQVVTVIPDHDEAEVAHR